MEQRLRNSISLVLLYFLIPLFVSSQKLKLIDSYSQSWNGGIAGRHGVNYLLVIEFSKSKSDVQPDTLWIGDQAIALSVTDGQLSDFKNTRIKNKKSIRFEIHAVTCFDDYEYRNMQSGNEKKKAVERPYSYHGVALLSYVYKNKKRFFDIDKIGRRGDPVAYP